MYVLKRTLVRAPWRRAQSQTRHVGVCSGCQRFYSNDKESPLRNLLEDAAQRSGTNENPLLQPHHVWASTPYPIRLRKEMEEVAYNADDMSIIMFPGQGTHYMGMGKSLLKFPRAKKLFDIANEVLNIDLLKIENPTNLLHVSQEMIVVCSLAAIEKLREERPSALESCVATAGFSLGEITALIFSGAIPLEQGIKLVSVRSAAMQAASKLRPGGMLTVMYTPAANVKQICDKAIEHCYEEGIEDAFCSVANYLYPTCKVLAGTPQALEYIQQNASALNIRSTKRVKVNGAFHSVGVEAAVEPFKEALSLCDIQTPEVRVMSGVTAKDYKNVKDIKSLLPKQIVQPVKWEQLLHIVYSRPQDSKFPRTFEVGPGKTLRAILKRVNAKAWDNSFSIEA